MKKIKYIWFWAARSCKVEDYLTGNGETTVVKWKDYILPEVIKIQLMSKNFTMVNLEIDITE